MINKEQIKKLIDEMEGLEGSLFERTLPTAELCFYQSMGGEVNVKVFLNGCEPQFYPQCATTRVAFLKSDTEEETLEKMSECIKALRECRQLRESSLDVLKQRKVEALRKSYEKDLQELNDKYMAEIQKYEG